MNANTNMAMAMTTVMAMVMPTQQPSDAPPSGGVLTREPVRITWVVYGLVQAVVTVLLATEVLSERVAAIITGVALALYAGVSELFVRSEVVPRVPLEQLAAAQAQAPAPVDEEQPPTPA